MSNHVMVMAVGRAFSVFRHLVHFEPKARLITLPETLIIPHITKTEFSNCFIIPFKKK